MQMPEQQYDLVIIGAGAGGLIAADFAVRLGAKTALVEKDRIGGDCTWTGCIPSKTLLKIARIAHQMRIASRYGITSTPPVIDMSKVHDYVQDAVQQIYQGTTPEALRAKGIDVYLGGARFLDSSNIVAGDAKLHAKHFLITTGASPAIPEISGLRDVPFVTYHQIFDVRDLPRSMIVIGGGPVSAEISQAYQRLGTQVTIVADRLLPKEDQDVRELMERVFAGEGIRRVKGRAKAARKEGDLILVSTSDNEAKGNLLLVAAGRKPNVEGLDLEKAGVKYNNKGITVDDELRTTVSHIYAAGDVLGGYEFSHFAGWQAFQAVRNALLPGNSSGHTDVVPWVTFTDPEVARAGLGEEQAQSRFGNDLKVRRWPIEKIDRAVCEDDRDGFIKVLAKADGSILGATIVGERAGEAITEIVVAMKHGLKVGDVAGTIHPYPTYSTGVQLVTTELAIEKRLSGASGKIIRGLSAVAR
jgi:pyruvate/2-oxoglutarate dehydrogenase complex dihydrolipoamide dehydrogenase (E3) component